MHNQSLLLYTSLLAIIMRSYLDLSKDEIDHANDLHSKSVVIDANLVGYLDYVGEDIDIKIMVCLL